MIYQRHYSTKGIMLVDIVLALALFTVFSAIIFSSIFESRNILEYAQKKNVMLDYYSKNNVSILPYEYKTEYWSATTSKNSDNKLDFIFTIKGNPYGNEQYEDITSVQNANSSTIPVSVQFSSVNLPEISNTDNNAGESLCSHNILSRNINGSYGYFQFSKVDTDNINITPISLPINPLLPLTDLIAIGNIILVSSDSNVSADPDIFSFDISSTTNPILISSVNSGPGIASFILVGRKVYAAARSQSGQVHIFSMDNTGKLALLSKYKLPLPEASTTLPYASSIFYRTSRLYLGTEKWDGQEFNILDISDPLSPVKLGGFETGSKINDIYIDKGIAYIADSDEQQLRAISIKDEINPYLIGNFSSSGWQKQEGRSLNMFEGNLTLGRTVGGFDVKQDHEIFHFSSTSLNTFSPYISINEPGGVYGSIEDADKIFYISKFDYQGIKIIDKDLNSSSTKSIHFDYGPQRMRCYLNKLYILSANGPVVYVLQNK